MTACITCARDMLTAPTCRPRVGALPYGQEPLLPDPPPRCRDCGVGIGGTHHTFCCIEVCACRGQATHLRRPCPGGDVMRGTRGAQIASRIGRDSAWSLSRATARVSPSGPREKVSMTKICARCWRALPLYRGRGRPRVYCSVRCRRLAQRDRDRVARVAAWRAWVHEVGLIAAIEPNTMKEHDART